MVEIKAADGSLRPRSPSGHLRIIARQKRLLELAGEIQVALQFGGARGDLAFGLFSRGDVADKSVEAVVSADVDRPGGQLDGKRVAVAVQAAEFHPPVLEPPFAGFQVAFHAIRAHLPLGRSDDELCRLAHDIVAVPAEDALGLRVPAGDAARGIQLHEGVVGGFDDEAGAFLALAQARFRAPPFDEHRDLPCHGGQRGQQRGIMGFDSRVHALQHTQTSDAVHDRDGEGGAQPQLESRAGQRRGRVIHFAEIGDPHRASQHTSLARQTVARQKSAAKSWPR